MRKPAIVILAAVISLALVSFMIFYTVRFTEAAVITTFGKAGETDVRREPGIGVKWPYPIQAVTRYDTRTRVLTARLETQVTRDGRQVTIESFCTWRVSDPLRFFQRFSNAGQRPEDHFAEADKALRSSLRSAFSLVSQYNMSDLFAESPQASKLPLLEESVLRSLQTAASDTGANPGDRSGLNLASYGIEATGVGISRIVLPEATTSAVFDAMKSKRDRVAKETETQGIALADAIKAKAESDAKRIIRFADTRAKEISTLGDAESVPFLRQMNTNSELAVFLTDMDFIRTSFGKQTTLVLSSSMPGIATLLPDALDGLKAGELPRLTRPQPARPVSPTADATSTENPR